MESMETNWIRSSKTEEAMAARSAVPSFLIRVQVYQGKACLSDKDFFKPHISIGSSNKADLTLKHPHIARRHAYLYAENGQIFVVSPPGQKVLYVNGKPAKAALLDLNDSIEIGPYTLKAQIQSAENRKKAKDDTVKDDIRYRLVFTGKIQKGHSPERVLQVLKKRLKLNGQAKLALSSGKPLTIKKDLSLQEVFKFKKAFEKTGAVGEVQAVIEPAEIEEKPRNGKSVKNLEIKGQPLPEPTLSSALAAAEDEEDEEEDDIEAPFSLREKLSNFTAYDRRPENKVLKADRLISVFKYRGDEVVDVQYVDSKESYFIDFNRKRFCLVRKTRSGENYFYFNNSFSGTVRSRQTETIPIENLHVKENLYRKRKGLYRISLPDSGEVIVTSGSYDYHIRSILPGLSPAVQASTKTKELPWKHGVASLLIHTVILVAFSVMTLAPAKETLEPETRFVQVDPHQLEKLQKKTKPVVKPPAPPKPEPVKPTPKPVEKKVVAKKKPVPKPKKRIKKPPKRVVAKSKRKATKTRSKKKTRQVVASKHPEAGGGMGKGNVRNRNVKQVGILSMLGDSTADSSQPVLAEVTNLDAVKSPSAGQAKFKVGGIKGKLGNSKIVVASSDVLSTKGDTQVLRSSGAGGKGRVAALEKGSVGQKKVMGMVQARLNRSVKIRGGMSREAVKRVIEQHLDEITYCYETALISNPSIKGKITLEWKIRMSGAVGEVRIKSSTVKSDEIYGCIKSAIKSWRFPQPVGNEVVVSYPFIFDIVGF